MAKLKTSFFCQNCGAQSAKWIGKCSSCNQWNTYAEEIIEEVQKVNAAWNVSILSKTVKPKIITDIPVSNEKRFKVPDNELNRVLGGGLVPGSIVLVGGEPGIGKSTLLLQIALGFLGKKILYISGEESEQQIRMRAERINIDNPNCFILTETLTQNIFKEIEHLNPDIVIVDSIQTLSTGRIESSPGSVSQVRECAAEFLNFSKNTSVPVFLIGHITKDGGIAGPKVLEHMVDTVLQFEGERHHVYRVLRCIKNRFGSTSELGIYEMQGSGLREVSNPSEILISQRSEYLSGVSISSAVEGIRPMLIEIQALVSSAVYGTPQRSSTGFDLRRLNMLLAVLEKRCGFRLASKDVFLNITGGIKIEDPSIDLSVICAILSSSENLPISQKVCFAGEIGLSGEIRPVTRVEQRISEAEKLGFEKIFISQYNFSDKKDKTYLKSKIELVLVKKVEEVFSLLFG